VYSLFPLAKQHGREKTEVTGTPRGAFQQAYNTVIIPSSDHHLHFNKGAAMAQETLPE